MIEKDLKNYSTLVSVIVLLLLILTVILNKNKPDWHCGILPILTMIIFLPVQIILNIIVVKVKTKKTANRIFHASILLLLTTVILFTRFLFCN